MAAGLLLAIACLSLGSIAHADGDPDCIAGCVPDCGADCADTFGSSKTACVRSCEAEVAGCQAACLSSDTPSGGGAVAAAPSLQHGNYCGPGHGDPTGTTPPVDAVDAVCRTHDLCYDARGYLNCGCDRELLLTMPAAIASTPNLNAQAAGHVAIAFFHRSPCSCQICLWPWGCFVVPGGAGGLGPC